MSHCHTVTVTVTVYDDSKIINEPKHLLVTIYAGN